MAAKERKRRKSRKTPPQLFHFAPASRSLPAATGARVPRFLFTLRTSLFTIPFVPLI
jgi:hypothetical protein